MYQIVLMDSEIQNNKKRLKEESLKSRIIFETGVNVFKSTEEKCFRHVFCDLRKFCYKIEVK